MEIGGPGRGPRRLHVVLHVPKCAGRSLHNHLRRHLGRRFWCVIKRTRHLPLEILGRKYDPRPPVPPDEIVAVSGHFLGRSIEAQFPGRTAVRSIILRQPRSQMLSWYNFRMMRYLADGLSPYSFELFLRSMPADPVANFLLERWLEMPWARVIAMSTHEKQRLLDETLAGFDRVVDVAQADELIAWHSAALGLPREAVRANDSGELSRRSGWPLLRLEHLSTGALDELDRRVELDTYLWRKWALKQSATFDPVTRGPSLPRELGRAASQIRRRVARRYALGTGLPAVAEQRS